MSPEQGDPHRRIDEGQEAVDKPPGQAAEEPGRGAGEPAVFSDGWTAEGLSFQEPSRTTTVDAATQKKSYQLGYRISATQYLPQPTLIRITLSGEPAGLLHYVIGPGPDHPLTRTGIEEFRRGTEGAEFWHEDRHVFVQFPHPRFSPSLELTIEVTSDGPLDILAVARKLPA